MPHDILKDISGCRSSAVLIVVCPLLAGVLGAFSPALAACTGTAGPGATAATGGDNCVAPGANYTQATSGDSGTVLEFTAPSVTVTAGTATSRVQAGAQSQIIFRGDLTANTGGANTRTLLANGAGAGVRVEGNLTVLRGAGTGAGVEAANGGTIAILSGASITSTGANAQALRVSSGGTATFSGHTELITTNSSAYGVISYTIGSLGGTAGSSLGMFNSLAVNTSGAGAFGLYATGNLNNRIVVTGPLAIETTGASSHGIYAENGGKVFVDPAAGAASGSADNNSYVLLNQGAVSTSGAGAHGVLSAANAGSNTVIIGSDASIRANGSNANGVAMLLTAAGASSNFATVNGFVQGGSGTGAGILTNGLAGQLSTVAIGSGATVQALSGRAVVDGPNDSAYSIFGTSTVVGSIALGNGSDRLAISGPANISGVTLFDGGDDVYAADGQVDRLSFAGGAWTLDAARLQNWESIGVAAGATLNLSGTNLLVGGGVDGGGSQLGLLIGSGGTFNPLGNTFTLTGDVRNAGTINLANGSPGGVFTVAVDPLAPIGASGNYIGAGGTLAIDTRLGADVSPSDRLVIDGGRGTGSGLLAVTNVGGAGDLTVANGITVVNAVNGGTTAPGLFALAGPAIAGPYEYTLYRGSVDGALPDNWYLRSNLNCAQAPAHSLCVTNAPGNAAGTPPDIPNYRPETSLYAALPAMTLLYGRMMLDTLHERRGERRADSAAPNASWARIIGQSGDREGSTSGVYGSGPKYDYNFFAFQGGVDLYRDGSADSARNRAGVFVAIGQGSGDVQHVGYGKAGTNRFKAYSAGAYWTHFTQQNAYIDALAIGSWYDADSKSDRLPQLSTQGVAFGASLEGGYPVWTSGSFRVEPQAQLAFQTTNLRDSSDKAALVRFNNVNSLAGRLGVRFAADFALPSWDDREPGKLTAWVRPSVWHEFLGASKTSFSSDTGFIPFSSDLAGTTLELNSGFTAKIGRSTSVYATASYLVGLGGATKGEAFTGRIGAQITW